MSIRGHLNHGCLVKRTYATKADAIARIASLQHVTSARDAARMRAYRCPVCSQWHVGRTRGRLRGNPSNHAKA